MLVVGMPTQAQLVNELEDVRWFLKRYSHKATRVQLGVVGNKYQVVIGLGTHTPKENGFWSDVVVFRANADDGDVCKCARVLRASLNKN